MSVKKDTAKHNVRACSILAGVPHHDKKGKNPNMKKKLL